jgi:hypothetical protein
MVRSTETKVIDSINTATTTNDLSRIDDRVLGHVFSNQGSLLKRLSTPLVSLRIRVCASLVIFGISNIYYTNRINRTE